MEQWRVAIGSYNGGKLCRLAHSSSSQVSVLLGNLFLLMCFVATTSLQSVMKALMLLILLSGDVERNPGPDIIGEQESALTLYAPSSYPPLPKRNKPQNKHISKHFSDKTP